MEEKIPNTTQKMVDYLLDVYEDVILRCGDTESILYCQMERGCGIRTFKEYVSVVENIATYGLTDDPTPEATTVYTTSYQDLVKSIRGDIAEKCGGAASTKYNSTVYDRDTFFRLLVYYAFRVLPRIMIRMETDEGGEAHDVEEYRQEFITAPVQNEWYLVHPYVEGRMGREIDSNRKGDRGVRRPWPRPRGDVLMMLVAHMSGEIPPYIAGKYGITNILTTLREKVVPKHTEIFSLETLTALLETKLPSIAKVDGKSIPVATSKLNAPAELPNSPPKRKRSKGKEKDMGSSSYSQVEPIDEERERIPEEKTIFDFTVMDHDDNTKIKFTNI